MEVSQNEVEVNSIDMKKTIQLLAVSGLIAGLAFEAGAQQISLTNFYNQNPYSINPAYAGFDDCLEVYLDYRTQWANIAGAPKDGFLYVHKRFSKRMGLGLQVKTASAGLLGQNKISGSYAYHLPINEKHNVHFGLTVGVLQQQFKADDAFGVDPSDDALAAGNQSAMAFTSDVGLMYSSEKVRAGVAIPQLFNSKLNYDNGPVANKYLLKSHFIAFGSYDHDVNESIVVQPSLVYRATQTGFGQVDANLRAIWKKMVGVGLTYRTNYGFGAQFDFTWKETYTLAYAYDLGAKISGVSLGGTHQILIGVKFCKKNKKGAEAQSTSE